MANLVFNSTTICTESSGEFYSSVYFPRKPDLRLVSFPNTTGLEYLKVGAGQGADTRARVEILPVGGTNEVVFFTASLAAAKTKIDTIAALMEANTTGTLVCNSGSFSNMRIESFIESFTQKRGASKYATIFTITFTE